MKVVLLAPTPPPAGGIASWTARMLNAELEDGWSVVVVDEKVVGSKQVFGKDAKRSFFSEIGRCLKIWRDLYMALKDSDVRVVHSCIPSTTFAMMREYVCATITHLRKCKFIVHFRCTVPNTTKGRVGRLWLKWLCNKSDIVISLNGQSSSFIQRLSDTPVRLIPNFVSASEINNTPVIRDELKTVLYVGGIVKEKGVGDCLTLAKLFPNTLFKFVGRGDPFFAELAREERLDNVLFLGEMNHSEVKKELYDADVFLFLSYFRGEGFSNALCEAMAAGLPCIVSDWAANADMIGEGGGFVVPAKDPESAARALRALSDKNLRVAFSRNNLLKVEHYYKEDVVMKQYVAVYNLLTNR